MAKKTPVCLRSNGDSIRSLSKYQSSNRLLNGTRRSEHAQIVSKWHPTISLATERAKKLRQNDGTMEMRLTKRSRFMYKLS